ncbi:MAG: sortase [Chloroflexi bacterium]|nr:sortase [Chloroflexota bacterium]
MRLLDGAPPVAAPAAIPFVSQIPFPGAARIVIPHLDVDSPVSELGTKLVNGELVWDTPKFSVGHHQGTAQPGEIGNTVFSGHISSPLSHEGNVFSRLPEIKLGDEVVVTTPAAVIWYSVTETKVVDPSHIEVMNPTPEPQITLITCVPDWVYTHRLIVTARPVRWDYPPAAAP